MSIHSEVFARYANAETELSEKVAAFLAKALLEIEQRHQILIHEFRVTMNSPGTMAWSRANCVLVSGEEVHGDRAKPSSIPRRWLNPLPISERWRDVPRVASEDRAKAVFEGNRRGFAWMS